MGISMHTTAGKILASVALVGTAAAVAGMGTYGSFSNTTNASTAVASGTVAIALGSAGSGNSMTVGVSGVLPGDTIEKFVTLTNAGDSDLNSVTLNTLNTPNTPSNLLTTDPTNGLQFSIENCSVAWTGTPGAFNCNGTKSTTLGSGTIITGADKTLASLASLVAGKTDYLKVTTILPGSAGNGFQGLPSSVDFTFTATQRAAANK